MSNTPANPRWTESADWLPCLSVRQPWAHYIMHAGKCWENRRWQTAHRGPLLIHAGLSRSMLSGEPEKLVRSFAFGQIIGIVELAHCLPTEQVIEHNLPGVEWVDPPPEDKRCKSFAWQLWGPRAFDTPLTFRGSLGLFRVPRSLVSGQLQRIERKGAA